MSSTIRYSKPFLAQVIARIDYATPVVEISSSLERTFMRKVLELFPISEPQDLLAERLRISGQEIRQDVAKKREWHFYSRNRERHLVITADELFITYKQYDSFDDVKAHFTEVVGELFRIHEDLLVRRFGLRYINNIKIEGGAGDLTDWAPYLNQHLLSIFKVPRNQGMIARAFHDLVLKYEDMNLRFQYGMHNPDFPAPIREKLFILDLDGYDQGALDYNDLCAKIEMFHHKIQQLFESCIKQKLRTLMRPCDEQKP